MANKKISELNELTSVVDADVVLINDADATTVVKSKWSTVANLMVAAPVQSVAGKSGVVTLDYTTDLINTPTTITGTQASAITANTAKVSFPGLGTSSSTALAGNTTTISTQQASDIVANNSKTSFPGYGTSAGTALEGNTALLQIGTTSSTALAGNTAILQIGTSGSTAMAGNTALLQIGTGAGDALAGNTTILQIGTGAGDAMAGNTALLVVGTTGTDALAGDTTTISGGQASAISANSAKDTNVPVATDAIWDTAGDLAVASGADAASKLAIGAAGQVLTVNAGVTGLEWAASSGGGGGGGAYTINNKTADYIVASGDLGEVITVDGTYTVTIPAGISAGFYCTVVNLGTGIVTIAAASGAYLYNRKHHFRLNGKGTSARIVCYAEDYYSLEGDVTGIDGLYLDVPGSTDYFHADDNSNQIYYNQSATTPMDAHWGTQAYLKITGDDITGNYKRYIGADGESSVTSDIDGAFTGGSGSMLPSVVDGDNYGSYVWDNSGSSRHTDGLYVYCGTGNTPTAVTVNDDSGLITNGIEILPVIYFVPSDNQASNPIWALSLYYNYGGTPTESGDAGGSGAVSQYGVAWWHPRGAGDRVEMSGHQSGSNVQAWGSFNVPKGYVYFS